MQFYPKASQDEARVHPGLYVRRGGVVDLSSIRGAGFGYREQEIGRVLPEPVVRAGVVDGLQTRFDPPASPLHANRG
jgi:hypothetical protein